MKIGILQPANLANEIIEAAFTDEVCEIHKPIIYSKENQNEKNVSSDLKFGNIDAVVVGPGSSFSIPDATTMSISRRTRVVTVYADEELKDIYSKISSEDIQQKISTTYNCLKRDFACTSPRIAVICLNDNPDEAEKNIIEPMIASYLKEGKSIHGPYRLESFIQEQEFIHFDAIVTMADQQTEAILNATGDDPIVKLYMGMPSVLTISTVAEAENIREAFFTAADIVTYRRDYDDATSDILPKLYHEHKEDGDRSRFAVRKPFPDKNNQSQQNQ